MEFTANIFLVGPPACGKTALGRDLAKRLGREFYDSDESIEKRTGLSVDEIFAQEGETRFREYETVAIADLTKKENIVLATGGGAVLSEENRKHLRARGTVIYLQTSVDAQLARIADDQTRPLLKGREQRTALENITRQREKSYTQIADITLNVDNKNLHELGSELIDALPRLKSDA